METRKLKIMFQKGGSGSTTTRISIPVGWVRKMKIDEKERWVEVAFDGKKITIQKSNAECNSEE